MKNLFIYPLQSAAKSRYCNCKTLLYCGGICMVARQARGRLEKRREERFVKSLTDAREILDDVIEQATMGDSKAFDALEDFSEQMSAVYTQAERIEDDN